VIFLYLGYGVTLVALLHAPHAVSTHGQHFVVRLLKATRANGKALNQDCQFSNFPLTAGR